MKEQIKTYFCETGAAIRVQRNRFGKDRVVSCSGLSGIKCTYKEVEKGKEH